MYERPGRILVQLGLGLTGMISQGGTNEFSKTTGDPTFTASPVSGTPAFTAEASFMEQISASHDISEAAFNPLDNEWFAGVYAAVTFGNQTTASTFGTGASLGTTTNFEVSSGLKIGFVPASEPNVMFYGKLGGVGARETAFINFVPGVTQSTQFVPGLEAGIGTQIGLQGIPGVSVFMEFKQDSFRNVNLDGGVASPLFNYQFKLQQRSVTAGISVDLDGFRYLSLNAR